MSANRILRNSFVEILYSKTTLGKPQSPKLNSVNQNLNHHRTGLKPQENWIGFGSSEFHRVDVVEVEWNFKELAMRANYIIDDLAWRVSSSSIFKYSIFFMISNFTFFKIKFTKHEHCTYWFILSSSPLKKIVKNSHPKNRNQNWNQNHQNQKSRIPSPPFSEWGSKTKNLHHQKTKLGDHKTTQCNKVLKFQNLKSIFN